MSSATATATSKIRQSAVVVEVGGLPIRLRCDNAFFLEQIEERYAGYVSSSGYAVFDFEIHLAPQDTASGDEEPEVSWESGRWLMKRGDLRAEWKAWDAGDASKRPAAQAKMVALLDRRRYLSNLVRDVTETLSA